MIAYPGHVKIDQHIMRHVQGVGKVAQHQAKPRGGAFLPGIAQRLPHPLDGEWGIFDTWVGIGFGMERIAMAMGGYQTIKRVGRSLAYLDGARLNV